MTTGEASVPMGMVGRCWLVDGVPVAALSPDGRLAFEDEARSWMQRGRAGIRPATPRLLAALARLIDEEMVTGTTAPVTIGPLPG